MKSAQHHIGPVGALAVALGIGTAVATGTGTAWADASGTDTGSAQASSSNSASSSPAPVRRSSSATTRSTAGARPGSSTLPQAAAAQRTARAAKSDIPVSAPAPAAAGIVPTAATGTVPQHVSPAASIEVAQSSVDVKPAALPAAATPVVRTIADLSVSPAVPAAGSLTAPRTFSRLLSVIESLAANSGSGVPVDSPALWALLGWTRRDGSRGVQSASAQTALPSATTALVTTPTSLNSTPIGWVTGQNNNAYPGALWTQTNNTRWANVYGTDLGIMWFNGVNGKTQLAFGDTFSGPNMTGDWRSNVLLLSGDTNLTDGLSLINTGPAYQFIPAARNQVFFIGSEVTNIPTSAVYANNNNYVSYMSVKSWDSPGRWTTNYSAISQYDPATDKWVLQKNTIRSAGWFRAAKVYTPGDQNFQQMAYVLEPQSKVAPGGTQYVYAFGTPSGRQGSAFLSRVPQNSVTDLSKYEYWDGSSWVKQQAKAVPVLGDSTKSTGLFGWAKDIANNPKFFGGWFAGFTGAKTGGNVSEMSIQYNDYLNKYVVLYGNGANNVILRTADSPEGPWSAPVTIATSIKYPGLYAPMIHPLSGTGQLTDGNNNPDVSNLYWNMSIWGNYNVVLMQTDLSQLA